VYWREFVAFVSEHEMCSADFSPEIDPRFHNNADVVRELLAVHDPYSHSRAYRVPGIPQDFAYSFLYIVLVVFHGSSPLLVEVFARILQRLELFEWYGWWLEDLGRNFREAALRPPLTSVRTIICANPEQTILPELVMDAWTVVVLLGEAQDVWSNDNIGEY